MQWLGKQVQNKAYVQLDFGGCARLNLVEMHRSLLLVAIKRDKSPITKSANDTGVFVTESDQVHSTTARSVLHVPALHMLLSCLAHKYACHSAHTSCILVIQVQTSCDMQAALQLHALQTNRRHTCCWWRCFQPCRLCCPPPHCIYCGPELPHNDECVLLLVVQQHGNTVVCLHSIPAALLPCKHAQQQHRGTTAG